MRLEIFLMNKFVMKALLTRKEIQSKKLDTFKYLQTFSRNLFSYYEVINKLVFFNSL